MTGPTAVLSQRTESIPLICASLAGELAVAALVWFGLHEFAHLRLLAVEAVGVFIWLFCDLVFGGHWTYASVRLGLDLECG